MTTGASCPGTLLYHLDASLAACTEELEGRGCPGPDRAHQGGSTTCEAVLGPSACELCAPASWGPREWRHAAHVGTLVARRCRAHRGRTGQPTHRRA